MWYRIAFGPLVFLLAACAGPAQPVPVLGDIAALRGEWRGQYSSAESGRQGELVFRLASGRDTATGEIVMTPAPRTVVPSDPAHPETVTAPAPQTLAIEFVHSGEGIVTGRLAPYRDPECGCQLVTTFTGRLRADTLEGTYTAYHQEMGRRVAGIWRAGRVKR